MNAFTGIAQRAARCRVVRGILLILALVLPAQAEITFRSAATATVSGTGWIQVIGAGTAASAASGNVSPGLPTGWQPQDLLLAVVESRDAVGASLPAGWTLLNEGSGTGGAHRASLFWKFASPGESAPVVSHAGGGRIIAQIVAFRGVDMATPFDTANSFTASGADTTTEAAGITTVTNGAMRVMTAHIGARSTAYGPLSGWETGTTASNGGEGDGVSIAVYWKSNQAAGAQAAVTLMHSDSAESHGAQLALRPGTRLVVGKPAGTVPGDVMVAAVVGPGQNPISTPPAGWELVRKVVASQPTAALLVYVKVAGGSEPSDYAWGLSPNTMGPAALSVQTFAGVDTAAPIDAENGQATASALTHATPSLSTTVAGAMLVATYAYKSSGTWGPAAGMTEAVDIAAFIVPDGGAVSLGGSYVAQAVAGASGAKVATASGNADQGMAHMLALKPAAPAVTPIYFIHTDHLNTPRVITNQAQQVVWRYDNTDPFGGNVPDENPSGLGTFTCNLRFPGQYFDKETNLHYNYFRDFDPARGQYEQSDPIGLHGGMNTYTYVQNNPLSFADPSGLTPAAILLGVGVRILGGVAAQQAIRTAAVRALGPTVGTVAACALAGACFVPTAGISGSGGEDYFKCLEKCDAAKAAGHSLCLSLYGPNGAYPDDHKLFECVGRYVTAWQQCREACQRPCP